ncbi:MAG TPA: nucleoside-diphosphate kinase [Candidatus Paceibacterota bacterium]
MKEKSLVLVKPDGISRGLLPHIIQNILDSDLLILEQKFISATEKQCREHYNVKARNYGATEEQIIDYLSKSYIKDHNICAMVVMGEKAIIRMLEIKKVVRDNFTIDTLEKCQEEGRALHNVMHSSETPEEAQEEIKVWLR